MRRAACLCALVVLVGCGGARSPAELIAALEAQGVVVEDAKRGAIQREFDNINEALGTGVPLPKLARAVLLDEVPTDVFWCPGKETQAKAIVAWRLRGPRPEDPTHLDAAAEVLTGHLDLRVGQTIFSMNPNEDQDEAVLNLALLLAKLEAR